MISNKVRLWLDVKWRHFCPKVRLILPLKLGSKCWKNNTAYDLPDFLPSFWLCIYFTMCDRSGTYEKWFSPIQCLGWKGNLENEKWHRISLQGPLLAFIFWRSWKRTAGWHWDTELYHCKTFYPGKESFSLFIIKSNWEC